MKKQIALFAVLSFALPLATPLVVSAEETEVITSLPTPTLYSTQDVAASCDQKTEKYLIKSQQAEATKDALLAQKRADADARIQKQLTEAAARRLARQSENDANWLAKIAEKAAKANASEAQKVAVQNFRTTVEAAQQIRRTTVNKAITSNNERHEAALTTRRTTVDAAIKVRREAIDAAVEIWKSRCALSETERQAANKVFKDTTAKARLVSRASIEKAFADYKITMETSRNQRSSDIKVATDAFKTALEKAKADLKIAIQAAKTAK